MSDSPYFAAVDLGSNSFHMLIGRLKNNHIEVIDREKEMVQIARGFSENGVIDEASKQRALDCLSRFSERLRDIPPEQVRAVGTKTLRAAKKSQNFLQKAEQTLGHPIQIISGYEEARLVYCGLSHTVTNDHNQRLVIDIGGGSTEFVIGVDYEPTALESLSLGCVAFTNLFFKDSEPFENSMKKAYMEACSELELIRKSYKGKGWQLAYGTSGTIKAIGELTAPNSGGIINAKNLAQLMEQVTHDGGLMHCETNLPKLRQEVLPAGIAILKAIFDQLKIDELRVANATLKEGLIFDTVGRLSDDDARESTVNKLMHRYAIDPDQAKRVSELALNFWKSIKEHEPNLSGVSRSKKLKWAANLHEIGLSISHSSYHNHGHYLIQHSDLAGFGRYEQFILASLVRFHRKKLRTEKLAELDSHITPAFYPLLLCLRLSTLFNRKRENLDTQIQLHKTGKKYILTIEHHWLHLNPLTHAGIIREIELFSGLGVTLTLSSQAES